MSRVARVLVGAEMTGRELVRRRVALALLTGLPLAFYGAAAGHSPNAVETGGVAMAFSVSGAAIFAALSARAVDERLALAGYRPSELLLGRLLVLELLGVAVAALFAAVMVLGSDPSHPGALVLGVELVALVGVPFGLAVGALAPHELEAVLVMIGVVGVELSLETSQLVAKLLPFWAPRRVLEFALGGAAPLGGMTLLSITYASALLAAAAWLLGRRLAQHAIPAA